MQDAENAANASHAARLNRLLSILQRLKWEQGEDGLVRPVSPAEALNDLGLYMLGHEIDMAVERKETQAVPEGWKLVPSTLSSQMEGYIDTYLECTITNQGAWAGLLERAPTSPLRNEAAVRAEARREALHDIAVNATKLPKLKTEEIFGLRRFRECGEDGQDHDVPATIINRLVELGLIENLGRKKRQISWLGMIVGDVVDVARGAVRREALEEAIEAAVKTLHPTNQPHDWTEYAKIRAAGSNEAELSIRALIENEPQ